MKMKLLLLVLPTILIFPLLQSCDPDDGDDCEECDLLYKPNVYMYPTEKMDISVKLEFPLGGNVVESIPEYGTGWDVNVDTNGLIDETYSYLFYESQQPGIWQMETGWVMPQNELEAFFRNNLTAYGFRGNEIEDYIEYWIPRLKEYEYYSIFPQTEEIIPDVVKLIISPEPDNLLRLYYVIKGNNQQPGSLSTPAIDEFNRDGFVVTEWGVVLK